MTVEGFEPRFLISFTKCEHPVTHSSLERVGSWAPRPEELTLLVTYIDLPPVADCFRSVITVAKSAPSGQLKT